MDEQVSHDLRNVSKEQASAVDVFNQENHRPRKKKHPCGKTLLHVLQLALPPLRPAGLDGVLGSGEQLE